MGFLVKSPRGSRTAIRFPFSLLFSLQEPPLSLWELQSPRKDGTIRDPTKELGGGEERWERERKDHGKTQEEQLWSLKPRWGHWRLDCSFHQGQRWARTPRLFRGDGTRSLLKSNGLAACKSFSLGP